MESVSTKLQRITEQAKRDRGFVFTNLAHLMDEPFLWEAYRLIRKTGARGVDGESGADFAENAAERIRDLHHRLRSGSYVAPPVKRGWIPKDDGTERPIGIPTFEDKIVQKAVTMLLEAVYEVDFHSQSYGFRPGRSAHQALKSVRDGCYAVEVSTLIDADIKGYFDAIDHAKLREIIRKRVNDGGLMRLINKWLKAGVMDAEQLTYAQDGSPQGGVISPMLANIYLNEVLDRWYEDQVKPVMYGRTFMVRYADDFLLGFQDERDARRVMKVLAARFAKYGLTIHPDKTKMLRFGQPNHSAKTCGFGRLPALARRRAGLRRPETFAFLGFTHYWGRSLRGYWTIKRRTSGKRLRRARKTMMQWCKEHMHTPVRTQWTTLCAKLRGHYQYYGIIGNCKSMEVFYEHTINVWRRALNRRNSKHKKSCETFKHGILASFPLPVPRIKHRI